MKTCEFCREFDLPREDCQTSLPEDLFGQNRIICSDGVWDLIPTLGCFTVGYTLLVNRTHRPSLYHCSQREKQSFYVFVQRLKARYRAVFGTELFMFEHGVVDGTVNAPTSVDHVHLHFLPCRENYSAVKRLLSHEYRFRDHVLSDINELNEVVDRQNIRAYLLYFLSGEFHVVDISDNQLPSQFLRKIIYELETSAEDDGWNWRTHGYIENMRRTYRIMKRSFEDPTAFDFSERSETYEEEAAWIRHDRFIESLVPQPFGGKRLLDVASGTGVIAERAQKKGWSVTAVDCCPEMLEAVDDSICKVLSMAERLPFADESFDAVVCRQGLQYMDMRRAIGEMVRTAAAQLGLLHATVHPDSVTFWQTVFNALGYVGKSIIGSDEIQDMIKREFPNVRIRLDEAWFSKEVLEIPCELCEPIREFLQDDPAIARRNGILFDQSSGRLHYTLEWHLLLLDKLK